MNKKIEELKTLQEGLQEIIDQALILKWYTSVTLSEDTGIEQALSGIIDNTIFLQSVIERETSTV